MHSGGGREGVPLHWCTGAAGCRKQAGYASTDTTREHNSSNQPPPQVQLAVANRKAARRDTEQKATHSTSTHLVLDVCREGQVVKEVCEVLPHIGVAVLAQALVVEAVPARPGRKKRRNQAGRQAGRQAGGEDRWENRGSRQGAMVGTAGHRADGAAPASSCQPAPLAPRVWVPRLVSFQQEYSHLGDLAALVVAAQDGYSLRVPHLERHQQRHSLHCGQQHEGSSSSRQQGKRGRAAWAGKQQGGLRHPHRQLHPQPCQHPRTLMSLSPRAPAPTSTQHPPAAPTSSTHRNPPAPPHHQQQHPPAAAAPTRSTQHLPANQHPRAAAAPASKPAPTHPPEWYPRST